MSASVFGAPPKKFKSAVITKTTPDHRVDIEVDIRGAKHLVLEVTDGGNGSGYDWADWIEPRLIGPKGSIKLTDLKWSNIDGRAQVNKNQGGGPLRVNDKPVAFGIGTHANTAITYKLPKGYHTFRAQGGLDNGGTDQKGSTTSVVFSVSRSATGPVSHVADGFQVDLIYENGLKEVGSWVVLAFDGKGRLLTSDRHGPLYRITVPDLGDANGEAKVERLPVDVGGANGILDAFGSLYVVGKGYRSQKGQSGLFRLTDSNGDDLYDKVEFLIPLRVGADHHAHNVLVHPDGKRLVILSGNNTDIPKSVATRHIRFQSEDHLLPRSTYYGHNTNRRAPGGFVLICNPDGGRRRVHCAGFRNPYDFAYNRDGELFTFDADMEYDVGGPWYRPTRVNHTVSGADFGWRWGAGKWPNWFPDTVGTVVDIGRGSPTGVVFGYGAKFPAKYQNALYIADWTYGRMFAVHLSPTGASYTGVAELFVQGRGMPISDVIVRPQDGALYYITGGRRQKSRLFRVTYTGDASTAAVVHEAPTGPEADLRKLRLSLEAFHGNEDTSAVSTAWPHLSHTDRAIRFAARTAIEHQAVASWSDRAPAESNDTAAIEAAVALARAGSKDLAGKLTARLNKIDFQKLALEQQLDLLRAYGLVFIRMAKPDEATSKHLVSTLSPHYPSKTRSLNHELCQMLLYLGAPGAVSSSVKLLLAADNQADEMFYSYHLRTIREGWSVEDHRAYFGWLARTEGGRGDYVGGNHFGNFLKLVRRDATKALSADRKGEIADVLARRGKAPERPKIERDFVKEWTLANLRPALNRVEKGRAFIRGKRLTEALCTSCHLFNGKGGALGPDLSSVGSKMNAEALLVEILEPSKVISEQHASSVLVLKNGTVVVGREVGGDEETTHVVSNPDKIDDVTIIKRSDIAQRSKSDVSLMPKNLLNVLEEEEILDVLMYLTSGGRAGHTAFDR